MSGTIGFDCSVFRVLGVAGVLGRVGHGALSTVGVSEVTRERLFFEREGREGPALAEQERGSRLA